MRINLIGNKKEGKGLASDAVVLRSVLEPDGHEITDVQYDAKKASEADLNIFLEVCNPALHWYAERNAIIPNAEWWMTKHDRTAFDAIWCKTYHACDMLKAKGYDPQYIGFTTEDVRQTNIKKQKRYLHIAGGSRYRNTYAIVEAWQRGYFDGGPELTVVASALGEPPEFPGMTWVGRIESRKAFLRLLNSSMYVLQPSQYEGFGVALWEARACGAVLITTDAPPMNEAPAYGLVLSTEKTNRLESPVEWALVDPDEVWDSVMLAWNESEGQLRCHQKAAREEWEREHKLFPQRLKKAIEALLNEVGDTNGRMETARTDGSGS